MKIREWGREVDVHLYPFSNPGIRWKIVVNAPAVLAPRETSGTHCTGGCKGLEAGLDKCGKFTAPGFESRKVHLIAKPYIANKWGILA